MRSFWTGYLDALVSSDTPSISLSSRCITEVWLSRIYRRAADCAKGNTQRARIRGGLGKIYEIIGQLYVLLNLIFPYYYAGANRGCVS